MYAQDALNRHPIMFEKDLRRCRHMRRKTRRTRDEHHDSNGRRTNRRVELAWDFDAKTASELYGQFWTAYYQCKGYHPNHDEGDSYTPLPVIPRRSAMRVRAAIGHYEQRLDVVRGDA